jgi:hypothetical protein
VRIGAAACLGELVDVAALTAGAAGLDGDRIAGGVAALTEIPSIFYSYSHKDESLRGQLEAHLSALRRQGEIAEWHDRQIVAGSDWARDIDAHLDSADIILLLLSADFIASDYCWSVEMRRALQRHESGEAVVIPIILRPVDWQIEPLSRLQAVPRDGRAVTRYRNRDEAWTEVVKGIRRAIDLMRAREHDREPAEPSARFACAGHAGALPRAASTGLRLRFMHIRPLQGSGSWAEADPPTSDCPFGTGCERCLKLSDFTTNAELTLDVTVVNIGRDPIVISSVGARFEYVGQTLYAYGIPRAIKLSPPEDAYSLTLPPFRDELEQEAQFNPLEPMRRRVDRLVTALVEDPVYLPAKAPYRFTLRFTDYQRKVPNQALLRLCAASGVEISESELFHVFTW